MRFAIPVVVLVVLLAFPMPARAQEQAAELSQIDTTLKQILVALTSRADGDELREDKRLMLQRLDIQSVRLLPIENERTEVRLRITSVEQELAEIQQKLRELEDMSIATDFEEMAIKNAFEEYTRKLAEVHAAHNSLLSALNRVEVEWAAERETYDSLAAAIDEKLGLRN